MTREELDRLDSLYESRHGVFDRKVWQGEIDRAFPALLAAARVAEEWKAKALRWDAQRQIVAGHYDDVRADYLELREWQRRAAAELRVTAQGFTANRALVRDLLARVKP